MALNESRDMFSVDEVVQLQNKWGARIVDIGIMYRANGDCRRAAQEMISEMYAYEEGGVLFKPTKAVHVQFRDTQEQALSYFVGGCIPEDHGFALQPWSHVRFDNHRIMIEGGLAFVMGNYSFTDANSGQETKVEFTFGLKRADDGRPVIFLHHSSLPYAPEK